MNTNQVQQVELLTEREVAAALRVSRAALRFWRARGGGPPWVRIGDRLIRYEVAALREWIENRAGVRAGQSG
jgi:predicted DNA-binding transcriptional regulator AlpA